MLVSSLVLSQLGCSMAERMKEPIAKFQAATKVVSTNARKAYNSVNGPAVTRALRDAQLDFERICDPLPQRVEPGATPEDDIRPVCPPDAKNITKARILSTEDLSARFDALQSLDEYADLLVSVANSDAPEKIEASASKLKKSLDDLAARIANVSAGSPGPGGSGTNRPNTAKFKAAFGLFSTVVGEVLSLFARKRRDKALKKAINDGEKPVSDLIEAINEDVQAFWMKEGDAYVKRVVAATLALNTELLAAKAVHDALDAPGKAANLKARKSDLDQARLTKLRDDLMKAINDQATFEATNPSDAISKMGAAHTRMIEYARRPTSASFLESVRAIELFANSAARLGSAVVKLAEASGGGQ
jgi:hypothetical protein